MKPMTIERVKAAMDKTDLPLVQGNWIAKRNYDWTADWAGATVGYTFEPCGACALSQVMLAECEDMNPVKLNTHLEKAVNSDNDNTYSRVAELMELTYSYVRGFTNGFDGIDSLDSSEIADDCLLVSVEEYEQGYADGAAIREELLF